MSVTTSPFRVLLVDDTVELRDLVAEVLEGDPHFSVVGAVGDGAAAVGVARSLQPDVVLLDLAMPTMDGLEALPLLRQTAPDARIVVVSGFQRSPMAASVFAGGALGYLEKGLTPTELRQQLLHVLGVMGALEAPLAEAVLRLEGDPTSPSQGRRFVAALLEEWGCGSLVDDLVLMTSELVTNAVVHAHSAPQIVVQATADAVRVEVHDTDERMPEVRHPAPDQVGGRGLLIVSQLSDEWGAERRPGGKAIWFTKQLPHGPLGVRRA